MLRNFASIIFFTRFMTLSCYIVMFCIHNAGYWELLCRDLFVCIGPSSLIAHEWPPSGKSDFSKFIHSWLFWQPAKSAHLKKTCWILWPRGFAPGQKYSQNRCFFMVTPTTLLNVHVFHNFQYCNGFSSFLKDILRFTTKIGPKIRFYPSQLFIVKQLSA